MIFSPQHERTEEAIGKADNRLKYLLLTDEDLRDIREIQPLVLMEDRLWNYETKFRGEETMNGVDCWVLQVRPRQTLFLTAAFFRAACLPSARLTSR